jgi:hypothetical protein
MTTTPLAPPPAAPSRVAGAVAARIAAVVVTALVLAAVLVPGRGPALCFLRAVTGVPCPFCGGTTAMVHLGAGRPLEALRVSPLAALGAPLWAAWPALRGQVGPRLERAGRTRVLTALLLVLAASWAWQLHRVLG